MLLLCWASRAALFSMARASPTHTAQALCTIIWLLRFITISSPAIAITEAIEAARLSTTTVTVAG
ncbi:Uncharacterised protein [Mycobacteroides abscessus subsp. massiliense]|nr:Uncharacterised protein [Mycobacteroides abscessus subsp. massiliense]